MPLNLCLLEPRSTDVNSLLNLVRIGLKPSLNLCLLEPRSTDVNSPLNLCPLELGTFEDYVGVGAFYLFYHQLSFVGLWP